MGSFVTMCLWDNDKSRVNNASFKKYSEGVSRQFTSSILQKLSYPLKNDPGLFDA